MRAPNRSLLASPLLLLLPLLVACGSATDLTGGTDGNPLPTTSSDGGADAAADADSGPSPIPGCVYVVPTAAQLACSVDSDCTWVIAGQLCATDTCRCPTETANASSAAAVASEAPPFSPFHSGSEPCDCPASNILTSSNLACVSGACALVPIDAGH